MKYIPFFLAVLLSAQVAFAQGSAIETKRFSTLMLQGEHNNEGDTFQALVSVENIGTVPAINVVGELINVPSTWVVEPDLATSFGTIQPNEQANFVFRITRDENDETILFQASADNAETAGSLRVRVPINPLVIIGFIGVAFVGYRYLKAKTK